MASLYLHRLSAAEHQALRQRLHTVQQGRCFICEKPIDLVLHAGSMDIDHIEPTAHEGRDDETNFALTHSSCNRSKQASDLRVARVLYRFEGIAEAAATESDSSNGANLGHVLRDAKGAAYDLPIVREGDQLRVSFPEIGDTSITTLPVHCDTLSGIEYTFAVLPIEYLHHDDQIIDPALIDQNVEPGIHRHKLARFASQVQDNEGRHYNPRGIGRALRGLVEEFFRKNPQLHAGLGWLDLPPPGAEAKAKLRIFDGQHKIAAQVLLGVRHIRCAYS